METMGTQSVNRIHVVARWVFIVLVWLFIAGVVMQLFSIGMVFLAGRAIWLDYHRTIGHAGGFLAMLLPIVALLGRTGRPILLASIGLFVLYALQYFFAESPGDSILRAFHAVNALAIFWTAISIAQWARRLD